jgi:glycine/D-amino acid oxidase-like deaminating enzyme
VSNRIFPAVDVAIVGGGITGAAAAYFLARRGANVAIFERGPLAGEQSSRAWGFVRQQGRHMAEVPLAAEAIRLWHQITEKLGFSATELTQAGILVPAENDEDEARVMQGYELASRCGLQTRLLRPAEIRKIVPEIAGKWRCALYTADDGHCEPMSSTLALAGAAQELGARVYENEPVLTIETKAGAISGIATLRGYCAAATVILANGVGAPFLAAAHGLDLPIQIVRASVAQTRPARPFTQAAMWGPHVSYRPRADGSFYVGSGYRGVGADYDLTVNSFRNLRYFLPAFRQNWSKLRPTIGREFMSQLRATLSPQAAAHPLPEPVSNRRKVQRNIARFRELFPHLGQIEILRSWAGRIDLTPDLIPIIDRPLQEKRLFVACGFSGHGFALGPAVGNQLSVWILDGRPSLDLRPFRYSRFREGDVSRDSSAL